MDALVKTKQVDGERHVLVRPGLSISLFSSVPIQKLGGAIANAVERYVDFISPAALTFFFASDGTYKALSKSRMTRDLNNIRKLSSKIEFYTLEYSDGNQGEVGSFAIIFDGTKLDDDQFTPLETNLLRMEFPCDFIDSAEPTRFMDFMVEIFGTVPFESGHAGYCLKRSRLYQGETTRQLNQLLPRFIGLDPSYNDSREEMKGHVFSAHWINVLNQSKVEQLGGREAIANALPDAEIRQFDEGVLVRNAKRPPLGDVNRGANDIGLLPDFARLTLSLRAEISGFGEPEELFDSMEWLARFDEMQSRDWDNS